MDELINLLKSLQADNIVLAHKAHGYHWNVEGDDFPQFHDFFGDIYSEIDGATDTYAEWIRMLDTSKYAPFALSRLVALTTLPETQVSSDPVEMSADLCASIELVTARLITAFDLATAAKQNGLANFFADRQTAHQKHCWQLRVIAKEVEMD